MSIEHTYEICGEIHTKVLNMGKAIRANCLACTGNSFKEVEECPIETCPLYPFRFGKDPGRHKRIMSAEQKEAAAKRLKKARNKSVGENKTTDKAQK